jgi:type I restriction enzyme S subunit
MTLGDVVTEIRNGIDLEQFDRPTQTATWPISRIETISEALIDLDRVKYVSPTPEQVQRYQLRDGDILFSHINSPDHIGKTALFTGRNRLIHGINLLLLRTDRARCCPAYLDALLKSSSVRRHFRMRCKKAVNQASLNQDDILSLPIRLPPLSGQQRIAEQLAQANRLLLTRRFGLELTDTFFPAAFHELFGPRLKAGPFLTFGDLVKITGGGTPARDRPEYFQGRIPWLTSKDMKGDYIWDTEEHITETAIRESATNLVPASSILLVVKSKVLMHRLPVAIAKVALCHGQDIKSIQCSDALRPEFARFVLKFHERHLLNLARGANTEGLTLPMLEELPVPTVPISEQEHFTKLVTQHERLRSVQREALRQAEHLFASLLGRAFEG